MTPLIKIENSIGNLVRIQNDIASIVSTYLSRDTTISSTITSVENTSGFRAYNTTLTGLITLGVQTWTVGSSSSMRIGDYVITTGATQNVPAQITSILSSTSILVNVISSSGSGTATGVKHQTPILIGSVGNENAEIVSSISITDKTNISLVAGIGLYHNIGETVSEINYDKIEIYKSATETGSYSQIAVIPFNVKSTETTFKDEDGTVTDFYKVRFINSGNDLIVGTTTTNNGGATDFATATSSSSVSSTTAANLINSVRSTLGIPNNDKDLTDEWFISALNDARRIYDTDFTFGRNQEWRQEFNYPIKMKAGTNFINLPSDIDFSETNRSLFRARLSRSIGGYNQPVNYVDKSKWNSIISLSSYSTNPSAITTGATSVVLSNTGDMPNSGTLFVATEDYTSNILQIQYTGNNINTNTLTGVTGVTRNIGAGTQFWLNPVTAIPSVYTVWNGVMYFDRPVPQGLQGKNVYIDYYKKLVDLTTPLDIVPEHFRDIYKHYLKFAVKKRRDDNIGEKDPDYQMFLRAASSVSTNQYTGQTVRIIN